MIKVPSICPVCGGELGVELVKCRECCTILQNKFDFSVFEKLNDEQTDFVLAFMQCEGSIKEMEKRLGVSYPTVKARLFEIKKILGLTEQDKILTNMEILLMLERGEIDPEQAADMIKNK